MHKRLKLAKDLLSYAGIIICSVDDYEYHNLRHIFDSIFGEDNRLGTIVVLHNPGGRQDDKFFATSHEYMLVYAKNTKNAEVGHLQISERKLGEFKDQDEFSKYKLWGYRRWGSNSLRTQRPKLWYPIYADIKKDKLSLEPFNDAVEILPIDPEGVERVWRWGKETFLEKKDKDIIMKTTNGKITLYAKQRFIENRGEKPRTFWNKSKYTAANGTSELKRIFGEQFAGERIFDYPKSPYLMQDILRITSKDSSTILDFFGGSGTTAQAVL